MKGIVILFVVAFVANSSPLGGWENGNPNDEVVEDIARGCVQEMDAKSNSLFRLKFLKLTSVKYQVVAGKKYDLTFEMGESGCMKNQPDVDLSQCLVKQVQECEVTIWVQPWLKSQEMEKYSCKAKPEEDDSFKVFQRKYNKTYNTTEELVIRQKIFRENMMRVKEIQQKESGSAKYGATEFADMSREEFIRTHLSPKWKVEFDPEAKIANIPSETPPSAWDWREKGAVTPVKNQGSCGSCWAFSTTGNVEGQWAIKRSQLVSLSEQELVDCDKLDDGCDGGLPINAYKEIERLGGLETEGDYPYKGDDEKCGFVKSEAKVDISGFLNISSNEDDMAAWLYKNGPISIGINAMAMQFYFGGVSHPWSIFCNPDDLDHGVLIVGYGVEKGTFSDTPYWIVKNSWGPSWGESGYYRVYRGAGVCGLNKMPTSALVN